MLESVCDHLGNLTFRLGYATRDKVGWQQAVRQMLDEIEATLAGMQSKKGMATARVRRDTLVRHFGRIRVKHLDVPGAVEQ